jgi:hypothetical protein
MSPLASTREMVRHLETFPDARKQPGSMSRTAHRRAREYPHQQRAIAGSANERKKFGVVFNFPGLWRRRRGRSKSLSRGIGSRGAKSRPGLCPCGTVSRLELAAPALPDRYSISQAAARLRWPRLGQVAALNLLAFAWHAALDLLEPPWQAAREAAAKRTGFFAGLLTLTTYVVFPSWAVFLEALTTSTIPPELLKTQKIE